MYNRQKECTTDRKNVEQIERMYSRQKECTMDRKKTNSPQGDGLKTDTKGKEAT